jgi:cytochrome c oxidase subunit 2
MTPEKGFALFPEQASTLAPLVDSLFFFITGVSLFFGVVTAILLIFYAIRYRRRSEDDYPRPIVGSHKLEVTWTIVTLVIFMVVFFWGATVFMAAIRPPDDIFEVVYVTGKQWMWKVQHPSGVREINALHVPVGKPVKLIITSEDVVHDFYVPDFRVQMAAVPGRYTFMWFQASKAGSYHLFCTEYCGTQHSRMGGWVVAMEPEEYGRWLDGQHADLSMANRGRQLFLKYQCVACHSSDSQARAPVLENLYMREVTLQDGRKRVADDQYIRDSIRQPKADIVDGFKPIMPAFGEEQMSSLDLNDLVEFIKTLKTGQTPTRNERTPPPEAP